jgi:hypothetical protein
MKLKPLPKWLVRAAMFSAAANFLASWWVFSKLGGYASYGYEAGGHYFLSFGKGTFAEVSRATFKFSLWYERSVWGMMLLALLLMFVWSRQQNRTQP